MDEYSEIEEGDDESKVECNDTDIICIEGYNTHIVNMETGNDMTIADVQEFMHDIDQVIECNNSQVISQDDTNADLPPINGAIDSACNGHLIDNRHMNHEHITQVKDCNGVGVQGIDRSVPPIPVLFTSYSAGSSWENLERTCSVCHDSSLMAGRWTVSTTTYI